MSAVFGLYYNTKLKVMSHNGSSHPKSLGYDLVNILWYSWPNEIYYMYTILNLVHPSAKPNLDQVEMLNKFIGLSDEGGFKFNKPLTELSFYQILGELSEDPMRYFVKVRHSGLTFMLNAFDMVQTYGICDWAYVYNINQTRLEVWHRKDEQPGSQSLTVTDDYERLVENFDLISTMIHDPSDLGRNQFSKDGMDEAYEIILGSE